jgi:KDO2-lipid IV(A) lauroyltransferase
MQSQSKLLDLAYRGVFGSLFPLFLWVARTIARRSRAFELSDGIIGAFMALRPKYLDAVKGNVAQVLGLPATHAEVERIARNVVRHHAYAWVDLFYFGQRPPEHALENFAEVEGLEHAERIVREGRGAILLTAHAGNFELGGLLLRAKGMSIHVVYKPDRFEAVERLRTQIRRQGGVIGVPVDGVGFSTLPLVNLLREGKLVGMQGDRDFSLNGLPIPFFGRESYFPRGPWELAAMTGAPILCSFFYMDGDGRFRARFLEPITITGERGQRRAAIEAGMRRYVHDLEILIRRHPDQWYCFYPFWDDPLRKELAAGRTLAG